MGSAGKAFIISSSKNLKMTNQLVKWPKRLSQHVSDAVKIY